MSLLNGSDNTGISLEKRIQIVLESSTEIIKLNDIDSECLLLIDDASRAVKEALKKVGDLEDYFRRLSDKNVAEESTKNEPVSNIECPPEKLEGVQDGETTFEGDTTLKSEASTNQDQQTEETETDPMSSSLILNTTNDTCDLTVFVTNIRKGISNEDLETILSNGGLQNFSVSVKHKPTHSFAFVRFNDEENYNKALSLKQKLFDDGQFIFIRACGPKRPSNFQQVKRKSFEADINSNKEHRNKLSSSPNDGSHRFSATGRHQGSSRHESNWNRSYRNGNERYNGHYRYNNH